MEWLMEELEAPPTSSSSSQRGKSNHGNGHITTKPVNTDGLRSFSLDDPDDDSEDEVLSVPGVRVVKSSGLSRHSAANRSAFLQVSVASGISPGVTAPRKKSSQKSLFSGGERRGPGRPLGRVWQEEEEQQTSLLGHEPRQQHGSQQETRRGWQWRRPPQGVMSLPPSCSPRPPIWTLLSVNVSVTATTTITNQQHVESRKRSSLLGLFFVGLHLYSAYSDSIQSTVYRLSVLAHEFYLLIADYLNCSSGQCLTCALCSLIFCHNSEMK